MRSLYQLKNEFQKRDLYAFSFASSDELRFFIENLGITTIPEQFISLMYQSIVNPITHQVNFLLLKQLIDVCQDSYLVSEQVKAREIKEVLQNAGLEDPPIRTKASTQKEKSPDKLNAKNL